MTRCDLEVAGHRAGELEAKGETTMKHIVAKLLALIALACSLATTARAESFAKRVDIGGGRMGYNEGHGRRSPPAVPLSGTDTAAVPVQRAQQKGPNVLPANHYKTPACCH